MSPCFHFIPAHKSEYYTHIDKLGAKNLVFDLEDGVPDIYKSQGRDLLIQNKKIIENTHSFLRVSKGKNTIEKQDLEIFKNLKFNGIIIPKLESLQEITEILEFASTQKREMKIIFLIESFKGFESLSNLCSASEGKIFAIGIGLEDFFANETVIEISEEFINFIKMKVVSACKAYNLKCIDTVSLKYGKHISDFRDDCIVSRKILFDGKFSIHPSQIAVVNEIFSITKEEENWANSIVEKTQNKSGVGYQKIGSSVISEPKLKKAQLILKKMEAINVK